MLFSNQRVRNRNLSDYWLLANLYARVTNGTMHGTHWSSRPSHKILHVLTLIAFLLQFYTYSRYCLGFNPLAAVGDISRPPARLRQATFVAREFD